MYLFRRLSTYFPPSIDTKHLQILSLYISMIHTFILKLDNVLSWQKFVAIWVDSYILPLKFIHRMRKSIVRRLLIKISLNNKVASEPFQLQFPLLVLTMVKRSFSAKLLILSESSAVLRYSVFRWIQAKFAIIYPIL